MRVRSWNKTAILNGHFDCDPGLLKEGQMGPEDLQDPVVQAAI